MRRGYLIGAVIACLLLLRLLVATGGPTPHGGRVSVPPPSGNAASDDVPPPAVPAPPDAVPAALTRDDAMSQEAPSAPAGPLPTGDREALERHLRRFVSGEGESPPHWSDAAIGSVARGVGRGAALARAAGDRSRRLLDQLGRNEALGLLDPIAAGLSWLVAHQGENGVFQDDVAAARCRELGHEPCIRDPEPKGAWGYPPAGTALAVMALLDFRDLDPRSRFEPALARGVGYLLARQAPDGGFRGLPRADSSLSLLVLARAAGATGDASLKGAVQRGLEHLARQACADGGYPYDRRIYGDLRETAWVALAVDAARRAGVDPPEAMMEGLSGFLASVWQGGHTFAREPGARDTDRTPWATPVGMRTAALVWDDARRAGVLDHGKRWLGERPPTRLYPLYFGAQAATAIEPRMPPNWRDALLALARGQEQAGPAAGTWRTIEAAPLAELGYAGVGTVHVTAVAILALEQAFRP